MVLAASDEPVPRTPPATALVAARMPIAPATPRPPAASAVPTTAPAPSCGAPAASPVAIVGPKNAKSQQRQGGEHKRHGVVERGLIAAKTLCELAKQGCADADDDGKHQDFDARRNDIAEHALGEEGRLVEQAKRDQHKACESGELELDQRDEQLHRQDEEGDEYDKPGDQQHDDLDEVLEERNETHELAGGKQDRLAGIDADLRDPAWLNELIGR